MATVEAATYINELTATWPLSGDSRTYGDDHLRLIKSVLQNSFPSVAGAVTATHSQLNFCDVTAGQAQESGALVTNAFSAIFAPSVNWTDLGTVDTVDINGGSIDGATIGAAVPPTVTGADLGTAVTAVTQVTTTSDATVATTAFVQQEIAAIGAAFPSGSVLSFAMETPPSGWLECDGSAVSRTTYSDLFDAIQETFGNGNGSTTFEIPDLRGRFVRGWANGSTQDPDRASRLTSAGGGASGDNVGSRQNDEFQSHTHDLDMRNGAGGVLAFDTIASSFLNESDTYINSAGGSNETRPKNIYLMYCIKT